MHLLIDTWNVLHQVGVLPPESAGLGVSDFYTLIQKSRFSKHKITFVCDGTPSDHCPAGHRVETVFTGPHRTADDEIMERVQQSSAARSILVVTSDREIIRSVKANGAQHAGSAEFLRLIVEDNRVPDSKRTVRPTELSEEGAAAWKEIFGVDDQLLQELDQVQLPEHLVNEQNQKDDPTITAGSEQPKKEHEIEETPVNLPQDIIEEARRLLGL